MEYLWLSVYVKLDYLTYINLLKVFKNAKEIYLISKDKDKLLKLLRRHCIKISYEIFSNLVDSELKIKSIELFKNLGSNNIKVIAINSKYYPKQLVNIFKPPLVLFAYGNISFLKNKIVYVYNPNTFSEIGLKVYNEFSMDLKEYNISIISDSITEYSNIIYTPYLKKIDNENVLVISNRLEENSYMDYEYITGVCDLLFIPEASYNIKIAMITDLMLEQGKDISVVPGSIYNKEAYFSNYLIKDGAICINSKSDLVNLLKK